MQSKSIVFLICFFAVCYIKPYQEIDQVVIKTDIEAVKTLLSTIVLDSDTKNRLIDLANDTVMTRLQAIEKYSLQQTSEDYDFNELEKFVSQQTIEEVHKQSARWKKWTRIAIISAIGSCISELMMFSFFSPDMAQTKSFLLFFGSLFSFFTSLSIAFYAAHNMTDSNFALLCKLRSNLLKNYYHSLLIKQLIVNAPVSV